MAAVVVVTSFLVAPRLRGGGKPSSAGAAQRARRSASSSAPRFAAQVLKLADVPTGSAFPHAWRREVSAAMARVTKCTLAASARPHKLFASDIVRDSKEHMKTDYANFMMDTLKKEMRYDISVWVCGYTKNIGFVKQRGINMSRAGEVQGSSVWIHGVGARQISISSNRKGSETNLIHPHYHNSFCIIAGGGEEPKVISHELPQNTGDWGKGKPLKCPDLNLDLCISPPCQEEPMKPVKREAGLCFSCSLGLPKSTDCKCSNFLGLRTAMLDFRSLEMK
ncbi:hypothetical protein PR202_ga16474 [Eleusine coracana subsp. coracana]|uniref:Uncharacterized protein n=1 Tax=Eleusine coracana subsp. coracana TaxID=191504 RepID=A0AAV5CNB0_ELECO|nr:hypothetical protein PR202_ga16474 [Eleusine coracana subsp. coracana]